MADTTKSSSESKLGDSKAETKAAEESHQEEIHRLRARIRELQAKAREKDADTETDEAFDEASDILRDIPGRAVDEASKFVRGYTMAYLEQLRIMGEMLTTVADEVTGRNRASTRTRSRRDSSGRRYMREFDDRSSPTGLAANLPRDIFTGVISAVDKSLDGPRRVVDRFYEAYRESDDLDPEKPDREKPSRESKAS